MTGYVGYRIEALDESTQPAEWIEIASGIPSRELAIERAKIPHPEHRRVINEKHGVVWQTGEEP